MVESLPPTTKLWQSNVFTPVCDSFSQGEGEGDPWTHTPLDRDPPDRGPLDGDHLDRDPLNRDPSGQ